MTYQLVTARPDPPRLALSVPYDRGRLTRFAGGQSAVVPVTVQGHPGLLESGPPMPQGSGVYWKPTSRYLLGVTGYKVTGPVVLRVARQVSFHPPGLVQLPVAPGRIITRQHAVATARQAAHLSAAAATAKLSSWTEVSALLQASRPGQGALSVAQVASTAPWQRVWAVLLTSPEGAAKATRQPALVVISAASGRPEMTSRAGSRPDWFAALTDRDPAAAHRCPGGSTALLPFGVLTRGEEAYTVSRQPVRGTGRARTSVRLILTTVRAVNTADPGLYGGCVQQDCSLPQLVWVTITTVQALPGKTVPCLPGSVPVPAGYHPKQVKQYFTVSVPGNYGVGCGPVPSRIRNLTDLAPPPR